MARRGGAFLGKRWDGESLRYSFGVTHRAQPFQHYNITYMVVLNVLCSINTINIIVIAEGVSRKRFHARFDVQHACVAKILEEYIAQIEHTVITIYPQ